MEPINELKLFLMGIKPGILIRLFDVEKENDAHCNNLTEYFHYLADCMNKTITIIEDEGSPIQFSFVVHVSDHPRRSGHIWTGKVLAFPDCCIKKFAREIRINQDPLERYFKQVSHNGGIDPFKMREGSEDTVDDYESPYISHIPCSPNCKKSLKMKETAKRVLNLK